MSEVTADGVKRLTEKIKADRIAFRSLYAFVCAAWSLIVPDAYEEQWFIIAMCEHLEALYRGEIRNLLINIPPRMAKTLVCSVLFPVWIWIQDPKTRIMLGTYSDALGVDCGRKIVTILQSKWFKLRYPDISVNSVPSNIRLSSGGCMYVTTPHGQATGFGADVRILDDPVKAQDAYDDRKESANVIAWYEHTWFRRSNDARTVRDLCVAQRLSQTDPYQALIDAGWNTLILPAHYAGGPKKTIVGARELDADWRTTPGERLSDRLLSDAELAKLPPLIYSGQFQQTPIPDGGSILKEEWLTKRWVELPTGATWIISVDAAFKAEVASDYVVIQVWAKRGANFYLVDQTRDRLTFTETCSAIVDMSKRWPLARAKIIEDKANGPAIVDALKDKVSGMIAVNPEGGKEARGNAVSPFFAAGNVFLPLAPWTEAYVKELSAFPRGRNDDQVDATSQALMWLANHTTIAPVANKDVLAALVGSDLDVSDGSDYALWRRKKGVS